VRARGDEGAGTVLAIALAGVVVLVGLVLAGVGAGVTARAHAQAAADLAALAAGDVLGLDLVLSGEPSGAAGVRACDRAREVAVRNGAVLEACEPRSDAVVVVRVARRTPWGPTSATARAGPS